MEDSDTTLKLYLQPVENKRTRLEPFRPKMLCPNCGKGRLDYNGLLELECPACGAHFGGEAACT